MAALDRDIERLEAARAQLNAAEAAPPPRVMPPPSPMPASEMPPPMPRSSRPLTSRVWGGMVSGAKTIVKVAVVAVVAIAAVGFAGGVLSTFFPATFTPMVTAIEGFGSGYLAPALNYTGAFLTDTLPAALSSAATTVQGWFAGAGTTLSGATTSSALTTGAIATAGGATILATKAALTKSAAAEAALHHSSSADTAATVPLPSADTQNLAQLGDAPDELLFPQDPQAGITAKKLAAQHAHASHHGHHGHGYEAALKKTAAHIGSDHAVEHLEKRDEHRKAFAERIGPRAAPQKSWADYAETTRADGPLTRG